MHEDRIRALVHVGIPSNSDQRRFRRKITKHLGGQQYRALMLMPRARWRWLLHAWLFEPWKARTLFDVLSWGLFAGEPTAAERREVRRLAELWRKGRIEPWKARRRTAARKQHNSETVNKPSGPQ